MRAQADSSAQLLVRAAHGMTKAIFTTLISHAAGNKSAGAQQYEIKCLPRKEANTFGVCRWGKKIGGWGI